MRTYCSGICSPSSLILDLWMAERDDGWTFLKRLWGDAETTHIPTVIVTGEPERCR